MRSTPPLDRVNGDITTLFFSNSPSISNGLNNVQGTFFEIDGMAGSPSIVPAPGTTSFLNKQRTGIPSEYMNNSAVWRVGKGAPPHFLPSSPKY
jgi:hypothetical protein